MKKIILILLLFLPFLLYSQTTYYIDPSGSNSNDGSISHPWLTLDYACDHALSSGDIIHVNPGTYNEANRCELRVNVSIEGIGDASLIRSTYAGSTTQHYDGGIYLANGTNTAQHISGIKLDGVSLSGNNGIGVTGRSNVEIYNCTIINFEYVGVMFHGVGTSDNSIYNCTITNSGGCVPPDGTGHHPNISLSNQTDFVCHDNVITQTARASNSNGEGISGYEPLKGAHIYNNTITCQIRNGTTWSFAMEFFKVSGTEINNNTIIGEVDMGQDVLLSGYAYGLKFHHNVVGPSAPNGTTYNIGLQCEHISEGVEVYNNLFKNLYSSIFFEQYNSATYYADNIDIYNNILYNCGNTGGGGYGIHFHTGDPTLPQYITDVKIWNNTIIGHPTYSPDAGIMLPSGNALTNFSIRNNIIQNFDIAPIYENQTQYGSMNTLSVENNLFYDNGNSNAPYYVDWSPSNYTYQNNNIGNPNFVDADEFDFHLTSESALAIGEGINVGLVKDYDDEDWNLIPSIGAIEYGTKGTTIAALTTTTVTDIITTTAKSGGNITDDGGESVTARGVCWSTSSGPTILSSHTTDGTGVGIFVSNITGLTEGLVYYVRAYATNAEGTAYGNEVYFVADSSIPDITDKLLKYSNRFVKLGTVLIKH